MAERGVFERPDAAIFANTQHEPEAVYRYGQYLRSVTSIPIYEVTAGDLFESASTVRRTRDGLRTYIKTAIPIYTQEGLRRGKGQRHCTRDFKILPVNRKIKELCGMKRVTKNAGVLAEVWIGISTDEAARAKPNTQSWLTSRFPLLELGMSREDCLAWMAENGFEIPLRSACTFCPFHDNAQWRALLPSEFTAVVAMEKRIQVAYKSASTMRSTPYFHPDRVPLDKVDLDRDAPTNRDSFNNECEGMCGV